AYRYYLWRGGGWTDLIVPAANGCSVFKLCCDETTGRLAVAHGIEPYGHLRARRERRGAISHTSKLIRASPFEAPLGYFARAVVDKDLNPGVRVLELKLLDRSFEFYDFSAVEARA